MLARVRTPGDSPNPWPGRSVFVTGAYGLLGGWLVKALVHRGARVTVLKRDAVSASALVLEGTERLVNVVHGDVCDGALLERALGEYEVETVFHLAAQTIVGVANRGPASTFETNIRGTWLLLEACRHAGVARTIVASSDKAYGAHDELPYREPYALQPHHPYDVSKAAADLIARSYWHTFGLPVAVTRFANLYGGGDFNFSRLVPEATVAAIERRAPVIRSDGTPRARLPLRRGRRRGLPGHLRSARRRPRPPARPSTPAPASRSRCSRSSSSSASWPAPASRPTSAGSGTPGGEIDRQWVDATKLRAATGWEPKVALKDGLRRTIAWYREHLSHRNAAGGSRVAQA